MLNKSITTLLLAGAMAVFAAGNTYKVNILEDTVVQGKQLKAGQYKVEVENNTATLKHGKNSIEVPAHVEQAQSKYNNTQVQYVDNSLHEIHVGGSTTRIVFGDGSGTTAGGSN